MQTNMNLESPGDAHAVRASLARRDWMLRTLARLQKLVAGADDVRVATELDRAEFLERHYARNRPVLLAGAARDWPAVVRWSPAYLVDQVGDALVEVQADRDQDELFERHMTAHRLSLPFRDFMHSILTDGACNDRYLTAYNSDRNFVALRALEPDLGFLDAYLDPEIEPAKGRLWIGPAGTFTPLHFDNLNVLFVQLVGEKRFVLAPPDAAERLYNDTHVYSQIFDLTANDVVRRFPATAGLELYEVTVRPGDVLFLPVGWWHQVASISFSVSATHTNFIWNNDFYADYPDKAA